MTVQSISALQIPYRFKSGLVVYNSQDAPNTKMEIGLGSCRDINNNVDMEVNSIITVDVSANGYNGLDTGTVAASKVYALYLISDSRNLNPVGGLFSLDGSSVPVMPTGYDSHRKICCVATDSSGFFLKQTVSGANNQVVVRYDAVQATSITAGNATSYTAVDLSTSVPIQEGTEVMLKVAFTPGAASRAISLKPTNGTGDAFVGIGQVNAVVENFYPTIVSNLSSGVPKISYKVTNSGDAVALSVSGYILHV
jgi:hypothetical protein